MKINEVLIEHSAWPDDERYTPEVMHVLKMMCLAASQVFEKDGIRLKFTNHFFDQLQKKRGLDTKIISKEDLLSIFGKILSRGYKFLENKPEGSTLVFRDPKTNINIEILKALDDLLLARTIIRDTKWVGRSPVITL